MRFRAYFAVIVTTIVVYALAVGYEIDKAASVQWGLIRSGFDLLFLVPLEIAVFSILTELFNHPSREIFGRMLKRIVLLVLGVVALIGVGIVVFFFRAIGGLPGVAH